MHLEDSSPLLDSLLRETLADRALEGCRVALAGDREGPRRRLAAALADGGAVLVDERPELAIGPFAHEQRGVRGLVEPGTVLGAVARALDAPVVAIGCSQVARLVLRIAAGPAVVRGLARLTNLSLAGRTVAVLGYGDVGASVARSVRDVDGHVLVVEEEPLCALSAALDGHRVSETLEPVEVVIACERAAAISELPAGALVASALPGRLPPVIGVVTGPGIVHASGRDVIGAALLSPAGDGLAPGAADVLLTLQGLALHQLACDELEAGVHRLACESEEAVAQAWLERLALQEARTSEWG
ncbi:hypothetical protein [Conexibacter sp. CPCC 206217]|uniref:hypothetical protein n=1 Tax=Conexibacter sp. CPCC 206217 TaxID=3064574 RepID=UPI0027165055|nr:hypothetical protein [Conexibacter sp. CPCC 206217]MDO8211962.1 hypothetical protein [Conexibacter sp. CPCC 206217]